ncbi:MAG: GntR family transcriptional regulator [Lachnospiraceae bacterium]|nr:GntR family transcriptional regulator [Lachnospiraceae bacterium]
MILLDYRDKRPLYEQVVEKLEHLIVCGALKPDSKMPSVRALAMELSINPNTIQRAYALLEQSGFLYTIVGRGNFVAPEESWQSGKQLALKEELAEAFEHALSAGMDKESIIAILDSVRQKMKKEAANDSDT